MSKYQVDYAGVGGNGVDQFIIVNAKTLDEYVDSHGDLLAFDTEAQAWEHISNLSENEANQ